MVYGDEPGTTTLHEVAMKYTEAAEYIDKIPSFAGKTNLATHSSILAWRNPWTEEPGRL